MPNIQVRSGGIMNNILTEEEFIEIASQLYGKDLTTDEYMKAFNADPQAKKDSTVVHWEVLDTPKAKEPSGDIYLDAATKNLSDAVGHDVTIEFADED